MNGPSDLVVGLVCGGLCTLLALARSIFYGDDERVGRGVASAYLIGVTSGWLLARAILWGIR